MINIPHIDLKIWDPEQRVIEIVKELKTQGTAEIEIDGEGSDCETLGLYKMLDNICSTLGYQPECIIINTCNQLEQHPRYKIIKHLPLYIHSGQEFAKSHRMPEKKWNTIKHFGLFIGRSSWQRLWMASHVWKNYASQSEITYHHDSTSDYHRMHLSFDQLAVQIGLRDAVDLAGDFMRELPMINESVNEYPILTPAHFAISKLYPNFFVEIVCETFLSGNSFYPTEKTWRPLICRTPFLTIGPKNFLSNLKKLGFHTFDRWWDESYDEDVVLDNGKVSINCIQNTLNQLSKMTARQLQDMHHDMEPVLEHNYQRFMSLNKTDFKKLWP